MALFVNFLIIALIIGAAGYQIYRVIFGTDLLSLRQNGFCLADLQGQRAGLRGDICRQSLLMAKM